MQYKHFLFNDFTVVSSVLIAWYHLYNHKYSIHTHETADDKFVTGHIKFFLSVFLLCLFVFHCHTVVVFVEGKNTSPGSFKWIKDILVAWKTCYKTTDKCFSSFSLSMAENHIFRWFCAINPCFHIVLKSILAQKDALNQWRPTFRKPLTSP